MVIAEVSVIPIGTKTASASKYVAKAIKAIGKQDKVKYQLTAMGTILEGELKDGVNIAHPDGQHNCGDNNHKHGKNC